MPGLLYLFVLGPASDGRSVIVSRMKFSSLALPPGSTALDAFDRAGAAPCYFANGDLAVGYHTCDVQSPVSSCCPSGYTCSGDALCILTAQPPALEQPGLAPGTVSRGACTEPLWNGSSCGGNCLGEKTCPHPPSLAPCLAVHSRPLT